MPRTRKPIANLTDEERKAIFDSQLAKMGLEKKSSFDLDRDWEWAYTNLGNPEVQPRDAPSVSAWELLVFGKDYKTTFMQKALSWHEKKRKESGNQGEEFSDDSRTKFSAIEKMIRNLSEDVASSVSDMARRDPQTVADVLRKRGWSVVVPKKA